MKKGYVAPTMVCEEFAANEYVAACGDSGTVYKFECNAGAGTLYYYNKRNSDGKIDGVYEGNGSPSFLGSFSPCPAAHEAESTTGFYDGFIDYNKNGDHDAGEGVIVWRGPYGYNGHATANLDMSKWETAKS